MQHPAPDRLLSVRSVARLKGLLTGPGARRTPSAGGRSAFALLLATTLTAAVPWPGGVIPTPLQIDALLDDALRLARRERGEELAAAQFVEEEVESAWIPQDRIDRGDLPLEALFLMGDSFFSHPFQRLSGLGGLLPPDRLQRVHRGLTGGIDTFSCMGCHTVGGLDGAGTFTQSARVRGDGVHLASTAVRNPPSLLGGGLVQALAAEMSADLQALRVRITAAAREQGPLTWRLVSKGVSFGTITGGPDGAVDLSGVEGVDPDLVVRPFGWKGDAARLRSMVEEASRLHFGAQSTVLEQRYREAPDPERLGPGPDWWDPDHDGVLREIEEGSITATAAYLAMLEAPVILPPADPGLQERWARGSAALDTLGCAACHVRSLHLDQRMWTERPDTTDGPGVTFNLLADGDTPKGSDRVVLFSDLKRHRMGEALADPDGDDLFLTRPLWGVADTGPWLHDGRAATLRDAIAAHGGEAEASRAAWSAAPEAQRVDLDLFLRSLTRAPRLRVVR